MILSLRKCWKRNIMDKMQPQSTGHVKHGHDESEVSIRGIVWSGVFLVASAFFSFVLMIGMIWGMEKWERSQEPKLTPMEHQLKAERDEPREGLGKEIP